jgi:hypothetical protein
VPVIVINFDGKESTQPSKFELRDIQESKDTAIDYLHKFSPADMESENATPTEGRAPLDPEQHTLLGGTAKYHLAWEATAQELLEESMFFSISHLIEAGQELASSLLLAQHALYKQSLGPLRSFLEDLVMPIHFMEDRDAFKRWREGKYQIPRLRGEGGLLRRLRLKGLIGRRLESELADLYGDLNPAIHGTESFMTLAGGPPWHSNQTRFVYATARGVVLLLREDSGSRDPTHFPGYREMEHETADPTVL